jgi:hypothetical protein
MRTKILVRLGTLLVSKRLSIIVGGGLAIAGTAGQFFLVDSLASEANRLGERVSSNLAKVETLKNAQLQYFLAYQQGSMLFAMDPNGETKNKQVLGNLYKLNLINRATPLRAMLGEMAIAGALNYRAAYDAYVAVNENARADFTWENYAALNDFERQVIDRALDQQHKLEEDALEADSQKSVVSSQVERRKFSLILISLLGSSLMLIANLVSTRTKPAPAAAT